jgi:hypothetical protein
MRATLRKSMIDMQSVSIRRAAYFSRLVYKIHNFINYFFVMKFQEEHYNNVIQIGKKIHENIGNPINKSSDINLTKLKQVLTSLKHYDEYYSIMDLSTFEFDWCFGLENVLGYKSEEWNHLKAIQHIHDDFRDLYIDLGICAYKMFQDTVKLPQEQLSSRYLINIPVRNSMGRYLWLKQMSMPLKFDKNGRMVKQFNAFTVLCRYDDVFLPFSPRLFFKNNVRARDLEFNLLSLFLELGKLKLEPIHLNILKGYCILEVENEGNQVKQRNGKQRVSIRHKEVAERIHQPERTVKKQSALIHKRIRDAYNITFPTIHHVANFFRPLFYEEIQAMKNKG